MSKGLRALLRVPEDPDGPAATPAPCSHPLVRAFSDVVASEGSWTAYLRWLCRSCGERFEVKDSDAVGTPTELVLELGPVR